MSKEEMQNEENGMKTRKKERTKIIVKAVIALVFFVFEAIPTLVDSISHDGITLFGIYFHTIVNVCHSFTYCGNLFKNKVYWQNNWRIYFNNGFIFVF